MQHQIDNKMQHQSPCQDWPPRLNHGWIYYLGCVELTQYWIDSGQLHSKLWWNHNQVHIIHSHFNCTDTLQIHWATHQYMWIKSVGMGNHLPIITNISHSSIAQKSSRFNCHIIIHMESVDLVCANATWLRTGKPCSQSSHTGGATNQLTHDQPRPFRVHTKPKFRQMMWDT